MVDHHLRRRALLAGVGTTAVTAFAGCTGDATDESAPTDESPSTDGSTSDPTNEDGTDDPAEDRTEGEEGPTSWTATMAPMGEVTFESVPESVMVYDLLHADLAVAYGHADAVNSLGFDAAVEGRTLEAFYERLGGVDIEWDDLTQLNTGSGGVNVDPELFYEHDSDVHLVDPALVTSFDGWERADTERIAADVGPWFANSLSRTHSPPPEAWRDDYEYYTIPEVAARVADVFRERDRYEALAGVRGELLATIEANLPSEGDRPTVATTIFMGDTFYPSRSDAPGFANAHVRPLGAPDAFAGEEITFETTYDYEAMLEFDPDVILHPFGIASYYDVAEIRETLADHAVGSDLTAVNNDRVYPSGHPMQGPVVTLFQLEMTAKQLYPEQFGAWPAYEQGEPYPAIPEAEQLFDRDRVADIITADD